MGRESALIVKIEARFETSSIQAALADPETVEPASYSRGDQSDLHFTIGGGAFGCGGGGHPHRHRRLRRSTRPDLGLLSLQRPLRPALQRPRYARHCHAVDDDDVDGIGQRSNDYPWWAELWRPALAAVRWIRLQPIDVVSFLYLPKHLSKTVKYLSDACHLAPAACDEKASRHDRGATGSNQNRAPMRRNTHLPSPRSNVRPATGDSQMPKPFRDAVPCARRSLRQRWRRRPHEDCPR
jgi:hypothetical protein